MKSRISALMDGELEQQEAPVALKALAADGEARDAWRTYHLISDALRETRLLSGDFAQQVAARLALEPTVVAPGRLAPQPQGVRWLALSAAASVAAVALVGWLAFAPQQDPASAPQLARAPQAGAQVSSAPQPASASQPALASPPAPAAQKEAAQVAPPSSADDYLLAHQTYSPRNSLQGVAPYVRTVSGQAAARTK
jgi:sigma-E factor negative regulatory protein RseA